MKDFHRIDYDASNPNRKLLLSPRGIETTCCFQLRNALCGFNWSESDSKISIHGKNQEESQKEIVECPFCGCGLTLMFPKQVKEISFDNEYLAMKEQYNRYYYDPEDALSMYVSLRNYSEQKQPFIRKLADKVCEMSSKIEEQERERLGNVTGVLTRSSAGFESACCKEFSENYLYTNSVQYDSYYADIVMKDGKSFKKFCPYCKSRMKRVPRTY